MPKHSESVWRNRVKELRYLKPSELADHPLQWRRHPATQIAALESILSEVGIAGALLAYESPQAGGALVKIDGHARASLDAETAWPVLILDVTDEEAALLLATHDPLAALAEADKAMLGTLLHEVQSGEAALQEMLSQLAEREGLIPPDDPEEHWQGMPEFQQEDRLGAQQVVVHFETLDDAQAFAVLVEQRITDKTKYLWYPQRKQEHRGASVQPAEE